MRSQSRQWMEMRSQIQDRPPKLLFIAGENPSITTGQEARQASNSLGNLAPIFKRVAV
jgi:hypothetical protein